ncbi:MAG: hypothetical protein IJ308_08405 [Clostridia bacterium]|nr:hypothetical protein [Clostridia bacterium]MBQ7913740.1 hypothetical protein [Clostridia bacterium]
MEFFWKIRELVAQNRELVIACIAALVLLSVAALLTVKTGRSGIYLAFSVAIGGGFALFALAFKIRFRLGAYAGAALCVFDGIIYLLAVCGLVAREKAWARRAHRREQVRKLQYCLPDRENTFVQARLNTVLNTTYGEDGLPVTEQIDFGYARQLLAALREKPLSVGEKLQAEDIGKSFGAYLQKPHWSVADLKAVNDAFSALMKLCAKYSVGV